MKTPPDFSVRADEEELMDDLTIAESELFRTLDELEVINRALGGYKATVAGISKLLAPDCREFSLLDVGCGGGDVTRRLVAWARNRGVRAHVTAVDLSAPTVEYARAKSRDFAEITFEVGDLFELDGTDRFDIVHGALVLHHFRGEDAPKALRKMYDLARSGLVINDLHRHPFAYWSIKVLTRILARSRLIRNDAPLSVLRAFVRRDWDDLGAVAELPRVEVDWRWAFRWQVTARK